LQSTNTQFQLFGSQKLFIVPTIPAKNAPVRFLTWHKNVEKDHNTDIFVQFEAERIRPSPWHVFLPPEARYSFEGGLQWFGNLGGVLL